MSQFPLEAVDPNEMTNEQVQDLRMRMLNSPDPGTEWSEEELRRAVEACRHGRTFASKARTTKRAATPKVDVANLLQNAFAKAAKKDDGDGNAS